VPDPVRIHRPESVAVASVPADADATPLGPAPAPALRVPVEFAAPGSGTADLAWGQMEIWLAMTRQGWLRLGGTKPLPPGTTVEEIADELRYLMERYPTMRTLLRFDENGRPTQELFGSGRVVLEVYDADGEDEKEHEDEDADAADRTVAAVLARYQSAPRDFTGEWPVRMAVVRRHGEPTHMVVQMCHLVTDGFGSRVMLRESPERTATPVLGMQQLELARWQCSEAGRRQHAAAERHWERMLRSLEPIPLDARADPRTPRHWSGQLDSPALYLAVPLIGERTQANPSTVLLALYAIALGRTGIMRPAVIRPLVHNRFRREIADTACNLVQSGICVLDVADATVDEAVRRAERGARSAAKYAYFDSELMAALFERMGREHGPHLGVWNFFNDRRSGSAVEPTGGPVTAGRLREAAGKSAFHWFDKKDNPWERLFLHIEDGPESIALQVCADTHCVSPGDLEAIARTMEAVAIEAALDPAAATGVSAVAHV
jgi:hypothetical protein